MVSWGPKPAAGAELGAQPRYSCLCGSLSPWLPTVGNLGKVRQGGWGRMAPGAPPPASRGGKTSLARIRTSHRGGREGGRDGGALAGELLLVQAGGGRKRASFPLGATFHTPGRRAALPSPTALPRCLYVTRPRLLSTWGVGVGVGDLACHLGRGLLSTSAITPGCLAPFGALCPALACTSWAGTREDHLQDREKNVPGPVLTS